GTLVGRGRTKGGRGRRGLQAQGRILRDGRSMHNDQDAGNHQGKPCVPDGRQHGIASPRGAQRERWKIFLSISAAGISANEGKLALRKSYGLDAATWTGCPSLSPDGMLSTTTSLPANSSHFA